MRPTIDTDPESFRQFLAYICPQLQVSSKKMLMSDINLMGQKAKVYLSNILAKQHYVATTAASWSSPTGEKKYENKNTLTRLKSDLVILHILSFIFWDVAVSD